LYFSYCFVFRLAAVLKILITTFMDFSHHFAGSALGNFHEPSMISFFG